MQGKIWTTAMIGLVLLGSGRSDGLEASKGGTEPTGRIIIDRLTHAWESQQVEEPCVLVNPKDPSRLVMFYSGVPSSNLRLATIGKAWASVSDPGQWHEDERNPIFVPSAAGWDSGTIRLDCALYVKEEDSYYIYYSGTQGSTQDHIGLAIVAAGADGYSDIRPDTIQRYGNRPVLAPDTAAPFFEAMVSQAAVLREPDAVSGCWRWYMYYSYRGQDGTLPGIRLATSTDGKHWTKEFQSDDIHGMGQIFTSLPAAYYEWHQIFKVGATYVLSMEVGPSHGKRWRPVLAASLSPDHGWAELDPDTVLQTKWGAIYSDSSIYHVATPAFYRIQGEWYLFAQACGRPPDDNYISGRWDMWVFDCNHAVPTIPGGDTLFIPGLP